MDNNEIYNIPRLKLLGTNPLRGFSRSTQSSNHGRTSTSRGTSDLPPASDHTLPSDLPSDPPSDHNLPPDNLPPPTEPSEETQKKGENQGADAVAGGERNIHVPSMGLEHGKQEEGSKLPPVVLRMASAPTCSMGKNMTDRKRTLSLNALPSERHPGPVSRPEISSVSTSFNPNSSQTPKTDDLDRRDSLVPIPTGPSETNDAMGVVPNPGSDNSGQPPKSKGESKGDSHTTEFEQWSHPQIMMDHEEDREGSDLAPFPVLETLSLINNLVSVCKV